MPIVKVARVSSVELPKPNDKIRGPVAVAVDRIIHDIQQQSQSIAGVVAEMSSGVVGEIITALYVLLFEGGWVFVDA